MAEFIPILESKLLKKPIYPIAMNIKAQKNYGLGIRMINWPNGKNFYYHNGWWHGNMASYVTLPEEKSNYYCLIE
jgi:hypothetical protein